LALRAKNRAFRPSIPCAFYSGAFVLRQKSRSHADRDSMRLSGRKFSYSFFNHEFYVAKPPVPV
jgi:hypothetical protein